MFACASVCVCVCECVRVSVRACKHTVTRSVKTLSLIELNFLDITKKNQIWKTA